MGFKNWLKEFLKPSPRNFAKEIIGKQAFNFFDVGAANGLTPHLQQLDGFTNVFAFEPHPESADKLQYKYNKSKYVNMYHILPIGLSKYGGDAILFMLNSPTGSSIFPINMKSPLVDLNDSYIFPIKELPIKTESLEMVIKDRTIDYCDMIKLDVQGAELDIVLGMGKDNLNNLLSIEMEVGFQSIYLGSPKPHDVEESLKPFGFELFDMNLVKHFAAKNGRPNFYVDLLNQSPLHGTVNGKLIECDMLFIKSPELVLAKNDINLIRRYIAVLCVYNLYTHAMQIADDACTKGIINSAQKELFFKNVKKWSANNRPFLKSRLFEGVNNLSDKLKSHIGQKAWHIQNN